MNEESFQCEICNNILKKNEKADHLLSHQLQNEDKNKILPPKTRNEFRNFNRRNFNNNFYAHNFKPPFDINQNYSQYYNNYYNNYYYYYQQQQIPYQYIYPQQQQPNMIIQNDMKRFYPVTDINNPHISEDKFNPDITQTVILDPNILKNNEQKPQQLNNNNIQMNLNGYNNYQQYNPQVFYAQQQPIYPQNYNQQYGFNNYDYYNINNQNNRGYRNFINKFHKNIYKHFYENKNNILNNNNDINNNNQQNNNNNQIDNNNNNQIDNHEKLIDKNFFKKFKEYEIDKNKITEDNYYCIYCNDYFYDKEIVIELPCYHTFHKDCLEYWMSYKKCCPLCKKNYS